MAKIFLSRLCITAFLILSFSAACFSFKILFLMPIGSKSHKNFYDSMNFALADAGHEVTMISPYNRTKPIPNIRDIQVESYFEKEFVGNAFTTDKHQIIQNYQTKGPKSCVDTVFQEPVQKALKEDYDLIILSLILTECYFPIIHMKAVPWIYASPLLVMNIHSEILGNMEYPSIVPDRFGDAVYPLTFFDRMKGTLAAVVTNWAISKSYYPAIETECKNKNIWSSDMMSISSFAQTASLGIINSVRELELPARPFAPSLVFAGGIHIKAAKSLTKDLESWIQDSGEDGFILFSLGSIVKADSMKEEHRRTLVNVFSKLRQKVIWKWDGEHMDNLPKNVKLMKWVPQADLLGHPKLRLFITHGGLLSTQEATYFGVPVLGMPVFVDQINNIERACSEGWALKILWTELKEDNLFNLISNGISNSSILSVIRHRSALMKDQPLSKEKEVVFWVEYVIRHGGAKHLQSPLASLPWYKIYNVDVWTTVFLTTFLAVFLSVYIMVMLLKYCCRFVFPSKKKPGKIKPVRGMRMKRD